MDMRRALLQFNYHKRGEIMANEARKYTTKLLEMMDDGLLDPKAIVHMCVSYMSESDVEGMMDANELTDRFTETYD